MTITKQDLEKIKNGLDYEAKEYFLAMSREDQLLVVLSMEGSNSNRLAVVEKWQIEFERKNNLYRRQREDKENQADNKIEIDPDDTDITEKIAQAVARKVAETNGAIWVWFRDRMLPTIATTAFYALVVLVGLFLSGKLP